MSTQTNFNHLVNIEEWLNSPVAEKYALSGLPKLNTAINSLRPGSLNFIVAGTGFGKTSFMVDMAIKQALDKKPALFFSCEMDLENIQPKFLANLLDCSINRAERLRTNYQGGGSDGAMILQDLQTKLACIPLQIRYEKTIEEILEHAIAAAQDGYIKHVFIDHFFEIKSNLDFSGNDRKEQVHMLEEIEKVAKQYGICFIIATQFGTSADKHGDVGNQQLENLKGCAELRYKATNVLYLYETEDQKKRNARFGDLDVPSVITIQALKVRYGTAAKVEVNYFRSRAKFTEEGIQNN